jgi:hypothetical protein
VDTADPCSKPVQNPPRVNALALVFSRPDSPGRRRTYRRTPLLFAALLPLAALAASGQGVQEPSSNLPDLDVAYISLTPRYPAHEVEYPDGFPQEIDPQTGKPLSPEDSEKVRRWPKGGETVTATARVVNHGAARTGPFLYTWLLDGKRVGQGRHGGLTSSCAALPDSVEWQLQGRTYREAPLRPGSFADLPHAFPWKSRGQSLELRVERETGPEQEISRENNSRRELTNALSFAVLIGRAGYNAWTRVPGPLGTYSFEDWVQRQLELLRTLFEQSVYPSAPQGVRQAVRIDTIRVLDDGEDPATFGEVRALNGWDGYWVYAGGRSPAEDATRPDARFAREVLTQLGIADLQALEITPDASLRRDPTSGDPLRLAYGRSPLDGTRAPNERVLPEHTVGALNRMVGQRRGYRGVYLYDVPRACRVRVLDNNGRAVADAEVNVYQPEEGRIAPQPVASGKTGPDGVFSLPNRPAPAVQTSTRFTLRPNPFGPLTVTGENGILLLRMSARGHADYAWLPVSRLNLAHWSGQSAMATIDLRTRLPSTGAPDPPQRVSVQPHVRSGRPEAVVHWTAPAKGEAAGYFIYAAAPPSFQFERVGAVTGLKEQFTHPLPPDGGREVRYTVTTVDASGNESGFSPPVAVPAGQ